MDNTWFVVSDLQPIEIYNRLAPRIFDDCHIVIQRMTSENYGLLPTDAWTWIRERSAYL
jgi:hypothetical protein